MYADTGLFCPCFQILPPDLQHFDDFCRSPMPNASSGKLLQPSTITEYDLGGEGDLFKAPEPILEEQVLGLDPMEAAISMISCGLEASILPQDFKVADISSLQNELLFSDAFYECRKDLMEKAAIADVLDIKIPPIDENQSQVDDFPFEYSIFPKSMSSECLRSMEWPPGGAAVEPNFLDFSRIDFEAYQMRRAFSEGDIKTLGNGNINLIHSPPVERRGSNCSSEERKEKLSRYKNKKTKRNFGRKIKYACRKALADNQPRIRGRFAKPEEIMDACKKQ